MILVYSQVAKEQIRSLPPEIKVGVRGLLESLREDPYLGKPLRRELTGFWSLAFRRYRVIYKLLPEAKKIQVYLVGHRSRIYEDFSPL